MSSNANHAVNNYPTDLCNYFHVQTPLRFIHAVAALKTRYYTRPKLSSRFSMADARQQRLTGTQPIISVRRMLA